jgi:hypothetical protein
MLGLLPRSSRWAVTLTTLVLTGALFAAAACGSQAVPPKKKPRPAPHPAVHAGTGIMRLGDTFQPGLAYRGYDYLIVGYSDVRAAASKLPKALVYKAAAEVTSSPNRDLGLSISGVSYSEAAAHGLLLTDASGHLLSAHGDAVGDIGSPDFQRRWVHNVLGLLTSRHGDGVFIDNVLCSVRGLTGGAVPAKYPTDAAWANAQVSFMAYVGKALHAKGKYVAANIYCSGPDNGSGNDAWLQRIAPYVDGEMVENFEQNPDNHSQLFFDSPTTSWMGNWLGKLNAIRTAQRAGKDAFALTWGSRSDIRAMTYGRASFLLVWNGKGGGFFYNTDDGSDPTNTAWTRPIGKPLAPMRKVGPAYVRPYSGGYVVVNPSLGTATVPLPSGLRALEGVSAGSSVQLAATTAAIFTR